MISGMPLSWRASLREAPAVLIAALSGRALAEAARASGHVPLVVDFFGDADTRQTAAQCTVLQGFATGFSPETLLPALRRLAGGWDVLGLVCGSGFENRPWLLRELAKEWTLLGNGADVVALVKDPLRFAALCAAADVPHPQTRLGRPQDMAGWLVKSAGGSGGGHVGQGPAHSPYFQRFTPGSPVSLLVLAANARVMMLGSSQQWPSPAPGQPFRYGGAVRPAGTGAPMLERLAGAVERVMAQLHRGPGSPLILSGLASFDFLVTNASFTLLEINPRPGATLDIFTHPDLFAAHIAGCLGTLPDAPMVFSSAQAAEIVYAEREVMIRDTVNWPSATKDRPNPRSRLQIGEPVCTMVARADEPQAARRILKSRIAMIRARLYENQQASGDTPR